MKEDEKVRKEVIELKRYDEMDEREGMSEEAENDGKRGGMEGKTKLKKLISFSPFGI